MLVKVCGVCRPSDAEAVAEAGADCIGVILSPGFRRSRSSDEARAVYAAAGGLARVGVFVDADRRTVETTASRLSLGAVQLHGDEPPELAWALREGGVTVWKVLRPCSAGDLLRSAARYEDAADAILLDGALAGQVGGSGTPFDWTSVAGVRERLPGGLQLLVAGGLTPLNVARAVATLRPDGVDVSSGVESAPGEKSADAVKAFVAAARRIGAVP